MIKEGKAIKKIISWNNFHAILLFVVSLISIYIQRIDFIYSAATLSIIYYLITASEEIKSFKPFGGYCNYVTVLRLFLIGVFAFYAVHYKNDQIWFFVLGIAVLLDGLDGYLARKFNHNSIFGQYLDLEVDALFVLVVSFYYYLVADIPIWILIPAFLRYTYKIARILIVKSDFQEPKRKLATVIAGVHFTMLLFCLLFERDLRICLLLTGTSLVSISFIISYYEFLAHKKTQSLNA